MQGFCKNGKRKCLPKTFILMRQNQINIQVITITFLADEDTNKEIYKFLLPGSKLILYWDLITIFINILSLWVGFFIFSFMPNLVNIFYINTLIILFILTDMLVDMNRPILI